MEDAYDEIEILGFPVTIPIHDLLQTSFRGDLQVRDLIHHVGKTVRLVGDFVDAKYVPTKRREIMNFGTFLDAEGDFLDTVHFPPSLRHSPLSGAGLYGIRGKIITDFGCPGIEVEKMVKLPIQADPRSI